MFAAVQVRSEYDGRVPHPRGLGEGGRDAGRSHSISNPVLKRGTMIPGIALMIALYGSCRLLNDGFKRHPGNTTATALTWIVSVVGIVGLCLLAVAINSQGAGRADIVP
jgi:hypothetical protein